MARPRECGRREREMWWFAFPWQPESRPGADGAVSTPDTARLASGGGPDDAPSGALCDAPGDAPGWWALRYTPRVARVDEVLLMEVSSSLRLWGGLTGLEQRIFEENQALAPGGSAQAAIGLIACAHLRLRAQGAAVPAGGVAALPLQTLSAARAHLPLLARLGLRTWGEADSLPRAAMVRRFGSGLRAALDVAFGREREAYRWITLPERFDEALELPAHAETAPALLWSAARLLAALQGWLRARQLGVLAFELIWRFDQKHLNGQELPPAQSLVIRTAQAAQQMEHLRRLLAERLAHVVLLAPVVALRLVVRESAPWQPGNASLLPGEQRRGEPLHVLIERASARLGPASVRRPVLQGDHRPECRQAWVVVEGAPLPSSAGGRVGREALVAGDGGRAAPTPALPQRGREQGAAAPHAPADALAPAWLLRPPRPLQVRGGQPWYGGAALRLLTRAQRVEAGWWPTADRGEQPAARDYFIAQSAASGLLWVYCERPTAGSAQGAAPRWFVQGLYA